MALYTSHYPPAHNSTYVKSTSVYSTSFYAYYATDPTKSVTGTSTDNSFRSLNAAGNVQIKFNVDLGAEFLINRVYLENGHNSGTGTGVGLKDFEVYGTNSAAAFADTTFSDLTDLTLLGQFTATQHPASDTADPQYFTLTNPGSYQYYVMRGITNYLADPDFYEIRRIEYQTVDLEGNCVSEPHTVSGLIYGGTNISEPHTVAAYTAGRSGTVSAPAHTVSAIGHGASIIGTVVAPAHTMDIEFYPNHATVGPNIGSCSQGEQSISGYAGLAVDISPEIHAVSGSALVGSMANASLVSRWHSVAVVAGAKATVATGHPTVSGDASQVFLANGSINPRFHSVLASAWSEAVISGEIIQPLTKVQGTSGSHAICNGSVTQIFHVVRGTLSRSVWADGDCTPLLFHSVDGTGRCDSGLTGDVESGAHTVSGVVISTRYFPILRNNHLCYTSVVGVAVSEMHEVSGVYRDSALGSIISEMHEVSGVA